MAHSAPSVAAVVGSVKHVASAAESLFSATAGVIAGFPVAGAVVIRTSSKLMSAAAVELVMNWTMTARSLTVFVADAA